MRFKLVELGVYGDDLEEIIGFLIQDNFLNEERFARVYTGSKFRAKKWGRNKIEKALKAKKVSEYCIRIGMQEIDAEIYDQVLRQILMDKIDKLNKGSLFEQTNLAARYAIQKGYEPELVWNHIRQMQRNKDFKKDME